MAKKVESYLVDDLDGSQPAQTVRFGLNGAQYEIDLADHNANELLEKLDCYIKAGRRVTVRRGGSQGRSGYHHDRLQAARKWLRENGHDIGDRGRIARELLEQYESAQPVGS